MMLTIRCSTNSNIDFEQSRKVQIPTATDFFQSPNMFGCGTRQDQSGYTIWRTTLKAGRQELAGDSGRFRKRFVQSCERDLERLSNGDVPRVVTCHVVTQFPDAAGEGLKRKQIDIELREIVLRRIRLWRRNQLCPLQATKYVCRFGEYQLRRLQQTTCKNFFRPISVRAAVNESGNYDRRINDDTQRRSAFRFSSICLEEMRVCAVRFLLRTC